MVKRITKFLVVILLVILLLAPTARAFNLQGWTTPGGVGSTIYITNNNYGLFCMNHGYMFLSNRDYMVYETGLASSLNDGEGGWLLSFIIGDMQRAVANGETAQNGRPINGVNTRNGQEWQELIWHLIGTNVQTPNPAAYAELQAKYAEYKAVKDKMNDPITIQSPTDDVVVPDANGMLGPFTVNYPYKERVDEHIDLKITVTDTTDGTSKVLFDNTDRNNIVNLLKSATGDPFNVQDTEFYLSVDEVTYGHKCKFDIDWSFTFYNMAQYWKLTPMRKMFRLYHCVYCDAITVVTADGFRNPNGTGFIDKNGNPVKFVRQGMGQLYGDSNIYDTTTENDYQAGKDPDDYPINANIQGNLPDGLEDGGWIEVNGEVRHRHVVTGSWEAGNPEYVPSNGSICARTAIYFRDLKMEHNTAQDDVYNRGGSQHNAQDYIFLMTTVDHKNQHDSLEVFIGQPDFEIELEKIDKITGLKLSGVQFEISVDKGFVKLSDDSKVNPHTITTTDTNTTVKINPDNETYGLIDEIVVKFKEKDIPDDNNHLIYRGDLEFVAKWNPTTIQWDIKEIRVPNYQGFDEKADGITVDKNLFKLTAENKPIPNFKILLHKIDALTGERLGGVNFSVEVENGSVVGTAGITTNNTSDTVIEIKPDKDTGNGDVPDIIVTLKELSFAVPNSYLLYKGDIVITYRWNPETCAWESIDLEFPKYDNGVEEKVEIDLTGTDVLDLMFTLTVENRPNIEELSGKVWIDGITGEKNIQPPNGIYDSSESFKSNIKVFLYKDDGTQVEYDGYGVRFGPGGEGYVLTDANGRYEFKNIPKLASGGYYIAFEYDGINYKRTVNGQSKADEVNRAGFNSRFKTITAGQSNDGTSLTYDYDGSSISTLITEDSSGIVLEDFKIEANTQVAGNIYNSTATDIDLGILRKVVDLALMTDLHKASATINGVTTELPAYNNDFDDNMNAIINVVQDKTADGVEYNINLYRSDYNYRIGNYVTGGISHQPSLDPSEQNALQDDRSGKELEVFLEYVVVLTNQSTVEAQVEEFEFTYDSHLVFESITGGTAMDNGGKLTVVPANPNLSNAGEYTTVTIVFKAINLSEDQLVKNYAEITKYSTTEGGYVDCDSAPGNAGFGTGAFRYEDDSDEARGARIKVLRTDREITGQVFEDNKVNTGNVESDYVSGNGLYDSGETTIDDVIVQLIEIRNVTIGSSRFNLEYIWQETTSGSNIVRKISDDGTRIEQYGVTAEPGKYTFKGFIPGNYIIRFIYGDGTYYDTAINSNNILKYNGQDYKSTVDEFYNKNFLIISDSRYKENSSMARDNEARRLEVMAYAVEADASDLTINSKDKLQNTWMAAETSKVAVADAVLNGVNTYKTKANFGLVAKPQTSLALRKHIISVDLDGGTGNRVKASVDMGQYMEGSTVIDDFRNSIEAENHPLEAYATTRTNRGYWQVEANNVDGANLTIKYQYRVENTGESEYLSQNLLRKIPATVLTDYDTAMREYANAIKNDCIPEVKTAIKDGSYSIDNSYLGRAYYTGIVDRTGSNQKGSDTKVSAYVNIEDYLNALTFDSSPDFDLLPNSQNKKIINITGNEDTETVRVIKSKNGKEVSSDTRADFVVTVKTTISDTLSFPSYIAQIVTPITNLAGTTIKGTTPNNLEYVQSYYAVARLDDLGLGTGTENDEFWAETFKIIPTTGADKQSNFALVISITTGLAIIVVGIVVIKKFMVK